MKIPSAFETKVEREDNVRKKKMELDEKETKIIREYRRDVKNIFNEIIPSDLLKEIESYRNGKDEIVVILEDVLYNTKMHGRRINKKYSKTKATQFSEQQILDILRWIYPAVKEFKEAGYFVYLKDGFYERRETNKFCKYIKISPDRVFGMDYELKPIKHIKGQHVWIKCQYEDEYDPYVDPEDSDKFSLVNALYINRDYKCILSDIKKYEPDVEVI